VLVAIVMVGRDRITSWNDPIRAAIDRLTSRLPFFGSGGDR
jgi:hypothetical protein